MANDSMGRDRDLVLPPNTFAFVLDSTKGRVSVYVGPYKTSLSSTDQLVVWEPNLKRFVPLNDVERAIQVFSMAGEGQYIVLSNPFTDPSRQHPPRGNLSEAVDLEVGRKVNVSGPATFPLWPGQTARTIEGHQLRHNQYLIVRVYDEQQARQNWRSAVMKPQTVRPAIQPAAGGSSTSESGSLQAPDTITPLPPVPSAPGVSEEPPMLSMGQLFIVRGTEYSFYIPPTGIEVVPEEGDRFVREAVTLERLEYCILLDESGDKHYMQGPAVVFPSPTEKFVEGPGHSRKFRAIELNEQTGLYVKVIAEYTEGETTYKVGDELFITGAVQAIYFPRPEHSVIEYDGRQKHHAIAVPAGEGRYVLDRKRGAVDLIRGPRMFLPDPRTQVVVRRILDPKMVELLYPGNSQAVEVNQQLRRLSEDLSGGEHLASGEVTRAALLANADQRRARGDEFAPDVMRRGTTYTPPRTITLDTKYEGAVAVNIWPGYAVLVTNKTGERRVEIGPKMVLLEYDETLMPLELSTGKPKDDRNLLRTVYLRVFNNQVSDVVTVETKDLVRVKVGVSYRVNFEGDTPEAQQRWFAVENYVKFLTDHARSRMRNAAKRRGIQEFYTNTIDIVRDAILGAASETGGSRPGLAFAENGMRVYDLEVLEVAIEDQSVGSLLVKAQKDALQGAIQVSTAEAEAERQERLEELKRRGIDAREETLEREAEAAKQVIQRNLDELLAKAAADLSVVTERQKIAAANLAADREQKEQEIELLRRGDERELARQTAEVTQFVDRMKAIGPELAGALQMFGDKAFLEKVVTAMGPAAFAAGTTTADIFAQIFKDTPFEGMMKSLAARPLAMGEGSRSAR